MLDTAGLPPLNITGAEAAAIAVALAALPELPFAVDGRSALAKVLAAMPEAEREQAESIAGRLWLRVPERPPRPAVARVLDEAVRRQRVVVLHYRDQDGRMTERAVEPVALAATGGHWHLLAWCRLRRGPRWFRTDRITAAHLTSEPAPEHDAATLFGTPPTTPARSRCADRLPPPPPPPPPPAPVSGTGSRGARRARRGCRRRRRRRAADPGGRPAPPPAGRPARCRRAARRR